MGSIDILMISEAKLDCNSPTTHVVLINGYSSPYRLKWNSKGEGILVYVQQDILLKLITVNLPHAEGFFLEINVRKKMDYFLFI